MKSRFSKIGFYSGTVIILFLLFELYVGYINWGQEFGAMGHYNRVAHVIEAMEGYTSQGNRLNRNLEFKNLSHLNFFIYKIKTPGGDVADLRYDYGTPAYELTDKSELEAFIRSELLAKQTASSE